MNLLPRLLLIATTAAVAFPLALWSAESFHLDCRRGGGERFDCVAESSTRGSTRLFALDHTRLRGARLETTRTQHTDGSFDEHHRLKLQLIAGDITSEDGDPDAIRAHAASVNAFIASPAQARLRFTLSNRNHRLGLAALLVLAAIVLTQDFSKLRWQRR